MRSATATPLPGKKPYRDAFGNPLTKQDVTDAVQAAVMSDELTAISLSRSTGLGVTKATRILKLLQDAKIVSAKGKVLFKGFMYHNAAVNAALRQLKKGKK